MTDRPREDELHAYVDGQLDPEDEARVEIHLAANLEERRRVESYRRHKALLRHALVEGAGPSAAGLPPRDRFRRRLGSSLRRMPRLPFARIAAGLAIFCIGAASHVGWEAWREWRVPAGLETAMEAHRVFSTDAERPVELLASRRAEMARWFGQHLGTEVEIPDLGSLALRLVGGRLLASAEGPMAQLLYEDRRGNRVTLYLTAEETDVGSEVEVVKVAGFSAGFWQDGELTYTIVADMEAEALLALAAEMNGGTDFPRL